MEGAGGAAAGEEEEEDGKEAPSGFNRAPRHPPPPNNPLVGRKVKPSPGCKIRERGGGGAQCPLQPFSPKSSDFRSQQQEGGEAPEPPPRSPAGPSWCPPRCPSGWGEGEGPPPDPPSLALILIPRRFGLIFFFFSLPFAPRHAGGGHPAGIWLRGGGAAPG